MFPKTLRVKDFGSFAEGYYEFKQGLHLVEGTNEDKQGSSNGVGKSAFFIDAPTWALFDMTCRGTRYDDVIRKGKKYTEVEFGIEGLGVVTRVRKIGKGSQLFLDGEIIEQKELEQLLGLDFDTFTSSIVHAQSFAGFSEKSESDQKSILTKLMGLDKWDAFKETAEQKLIENNNKITEFELSVKYDREHLGGLKSKDYTVHKKDFDRDIAERQKVIETELTQALTKFKTIETELTVSDLSEKVVESTEKHLNNVIEQRKEIWNALNKQNMEITKIKTEIKTTEKVNRELDEKIEGIKSLTGDCPVCMRKITKQSVSKCVKVVEEDKKVNLRQIESYTDSITKMEEKQAELEMKVGESDKEVHKTREELSSLKSKEQSKNFLQSQLNTLHNQIKKLTTEQANLNLKINPFIQLEEEAKKEIKKLEKEIEGQDKLIKKYETQSQYYKFWAIGFGNKGIKSFIFDSIIPEFTMRTNKYMQLLTNKNIQIMFDTQREKKTGGLSEKFTINISDDAGVRPYNAWSGGERKRLSIAVNMALADLVLLHSKSLWDFTIFDEVFDGLDSEGREMLLYLMEEVMGERKMVYLISHDDTMKGMVDNRVIIRKEGGISYI